MSDIPKLLRHREKTVRANAAMILGRMGEPSAIQPLKDLWLDDRDKRVRVQVTEALALLGDQRSVALLETHTTRPFLDDQISAIQTRTKIHSPQAIRVLAELFKKRKVRAHPSVQIAALGALAELDNKTAAGYRYCLEALLSPELLMKEFYKESGNGQTEVSQDEAASVQTLAAMSLGQMGDEKAVGHLVPFLENADGTVRVAAAMSILKLLPGYDPAAASQAPAEALEIVEPAQTKPKKDTKIFSAGGKD